MSKYLAFCLALLAGASAARADNQIIINVGDHGLQPGVAGQQVQILVSGNVNILSDVVDCQVDQGGPQVKPGSLTGPTITELDVIAGTIFNLNHNGQSPGTTGYIYDQLASRGTIAASGSGLVNPNGILCTITFDTTKFTTPGQSWPLNLYNTGNGNTTFTTTIPSFSEIAPTITEGSIYILPEPGTALFAVAGGAALLLRRRRVGAKV